MVLRMWRARSTAEKSASYVDHVTKNVFPLLCSIEGHRGAYLLKRGLDNVIEFVVLTLWESMEAVHSFAGPKTEKAVVDPDAQAVLTSYDESATHYQVVYRGEVAAK
jgi:heme-degrading monooxygenase HmoA